MNDPLTEAAAKEAVDIAKRFLGEISKEPLSAVGGLLADQVSYWRFRNRINLLLKSRDLLKQKGIKPDKILPDVFVPLLEDGSSTGDPTLSSMFASLLTSQLDPATQNEIHPAYSKILSELSPLDARMIAGMYHSLKVRNLNMRKHGFTLANAAKKYQIAEAITLLSFQNLWRLGICDHGFDALARINQERQICFTDYGWSFATACLQHA